MKFALLTSVGYGMATETIETVATDDAAPVRRQSTSRSSNDDVGSWSSLEFVPQSTYEHVQELISHGMAKDVQSYQRHHGYDCGLDSATGARFVGLEMSVGECKENCTKDLQCSCAQYDRSSRSCFVARISLCHEKKCGRSQTSDVYLQKAKWARDTKKVTRFAGKACDAGTGGIALGPSEQVSLKDCQQSCAKNDACTCFKYNRGTGKCTAMKDCRIAQCKSANSEDMYLHEAVHNGYAAQHEGLPW